LFVSTISVYADQMQAGLTEDAALLRLDDPATEEVDGATYGGLKVLCEEALARVFPPERRLIVRPGIVVGPHDPNDRFTYWPARVAHGGEVLAPAGPALELQWIDGRDLADFMLGALERGVTGTYNAVSEAGRFKLGDMLAAAKRTSGSDSTLTWVSEEFLLEHEVVPFGDLPLWLPGAAGNMFKVDGSRAAAAGLRVRPFEETVEDTLAWQAERGEPALKVGLSAAREAELLELWRRR
jgi:2'-hydroxyisoflavone reductase